MRPGSYGTNLDNGVRYVREVTKGGGAVSSRILQKELSISRGTANSILLVASLKKIIYPVMPESRTFGLYTRKKYSKLYRNIAQNHNKVLGR